MKNPKIESQLAPTHRIPKEVVGERITETEVIYRKNVFIYIHHQGVCMALFLKHFIFLHVHTWCVSKNLALRNLPVKKNLRGVKLKKINFKMFQFLTLF